MNSSFITIKDVQKRSRRLAESSTRKPDSIYERRCMQAIKSNKPSILVSCIEQIRNIGNFNIDLVLECYNTLSDIGNVSQINSSANIIISEAEAKIRDANALNNLLKQRLGRLTHKNATKISNKLDDAFDAVGNSLSQMQSKFQSSISINSSTNSKEATAEASINGYKRMIDESIKLIHCDRIIENYGSISKRFNIDKLFSENSYINGVEDSVNELCKLIDTYNMDTGTKYNTVIESAWYALNTNHIQHDMGTVLEVATDYFLQKENGLYICRSILEGSVVINKDDKSKVIYITKEDPEEKEKIEDSVQEALYSYINSVKPISEDGEQEKEKTEAESAAKSVYDTTMENAPILAAAFNNFTAGNYSAIKLSNGDFYNNLKNNIEFIQKNVPSDIQSMITGAVDKLPDDIEKCRTLLTAKSKYIAQMDAFYREFISSNIRLVDHCRNTLGGNAISNAGEAKKISEYLDENIHKYKKRDGVYDLTPIGLGVIYHTTKNTNMDSWAPNKLIGYLSQGYDCIICAHTVGTSRKEVENNARKANKDKFGNDSELVQIRNIFAMKERENRKLTVAEANKIKELAKAGNIDIHKLPKTSNEIDKILTGKINIPNFFTNMISGDPSKDWIIQPVMTLSGGPFTDMNQLLENLIAEGRKNVLICTTNRHGAKIIDKIRDTPGFKVSVNEVKQESYTISDIDQMILEMDTESLELAESFGIDYNDDEKLYEGYKFIQNNDLLSLVLEDTAPINGGWKGLFELLSQLISGILSMRKNLSNVLKAAKEKLMKYNSGALGTSQTVTQQSSEKEKKEKKITVNIISVNGNTCEVKESIIKNMSELIAIVTDATDAITKSSNSFTAAQNEIYGKYKVELKRKEAASSAAAQKKNTVQKPKVKQIGAKPGINFNLPKVTFGNGTSAKAPAAGTKKPQSTTKQQIQHNSVEMSEYGQWLDNVVYHNAHGYLIEKAEDKKDFQQIFNDFKKNNSEGDIASKLSNLVRTLYSTNVENVVAGTPNLLSYIRRLLILSSGAINPILMIIGLIANEFVEIHMERKDVKQMIQAFKNEKNIARGKMNSSEDPEEKERLQAYIKSLDKAINKVETYQLMILSDKEIEDKYNNYSSTNDFKGEVDPDASDEDLDKMLNDLNDDDFNIDFNEANACKFIPLIASLCETLVEKETQIANRDNLKMFSIMSDEDIKNYAVFSTMFPDCIDPDDTYTSISKYYDNITREGTGIRFESSVERYHKLNACKDAMKIIENAKHPEATIDIYENCYNIYKCFIGLKALSEFDYCLNNKGSFFLEASLTNKLKLAGENLRRSIVKMSDKEKSISKSVDVTLNNMMKGVEKSLTNDNRAAVINGSIIPSASKVIKLAMTAGVAYLIQPALAVITVLGYLGISKGLQAKERKRIIDELDIELKMCNKYIEVAESKGDMKNLKQLYTIQRELERQRQRLKYNLNAKGVVLVEPTSNGGY